MKSLAHLPRVPPRRRDWLIRVPGVDPAFPSAVRLLSPDLETTASIRYQRPARVSEAQFVSVENEGLLA